LQQQAVVRDANWDWSSTNFALQLQSHISEAAEELFEVCQSLALEGKGGGGGVAGGGGGSAAAGASASEALWRRLLLCLQGDACKRLHGPVMAHLRRVMEKECRLLGSALGSGGVQSAEVCASALGIAPGFRVAQAEAIALVGGLEAAHCPLSKLQLLYAAKCAIISTIERDLVGRGVNLMDVAFGADDALPQMSFVLAQCFAADPDSGRKRAAADFPAHLAFIQLCHHPLAGSLSQSKMGYTLANWDTATQFAVK